jgi:hypothetical protein
MTDNTYHGWTNYETWMVGLWFNDGFDKHSGSELEADDYRDWVWNYLEDNTEITGFVADVVLGFMASVNWAELADHVRDAHKPEGPYAEDLCRNGVAMAECECC